MERKKDDQSINPEGSGMLIVSRRPGQSVLIGKDIEVFVLGVDGYQVRVGIKAPRSIYVLRRELLTVVGNPKTQIFLADISPGIQPDSITPPSPGS